MNQSCNFKTIIDIRSPKKRGKLSNKHPENSKDPGVSAFQRIFGLQSRFQESYLQVWPIFSMKNVEDLTKKLKKYKKKYI